MTSVCGLKSFSDLFRDRECLVNLDRTLLDAIRQRRPLDQFEDQRPDALSLLQAVDAPDVRMVQRGRCLRRSLLIVSKGETTGSPRRLHLSDERDRRNGVLQARVRQL